MSGYDLHYNYDDVHHRVVTVGLISVLEDSVAWTLRTGTSHLEVRQVQVPFYFSTTGSERYLQDLFANDSVSDPASEKAEGFYNSIPRGIVTFQGGSVLTNEITQKNVRVERTRMVEDGTLRTFSVECFFVPMELSYSVTVHVDSILDQMKCSQSMVRSFYKNRPFQVHFDGIRIPCLAEFPDEDSHERTVEFSFDEKKSYTVKSDIKVRTTLPVFDQRTEIFKGRRIQGFYTSTQLVGGDASILDSDGVPIGSPLLPVVSGGSTAHPEVVIGGTGSFVPGPAWPISPSGPLPPIPLPVGTDDPRPGPVDVFGEPVTVNGGAVMVPHLRVVDQDGFPIGEVDPVTGVVTVASSPPGPTACDPGAVFTSDGGQLLFSVPSGGTYNIPEVHLQFEDWNGIPEVYRPDIPMGLFLEGSDENGIMGHLVVDYVIPSRFVKNSLGAPAWSFKVTLEDLITDSLHAADAGVSLTGISIATIPSATSLDLTGNSVMDAVHISGATWGGLWEPLPGNSGYAHPGATAGDGMFRGDNGNWWILEGGFELYSGPSNSSDPWDGPWTPVSALDPIDVRRAVVSDAFRPVGPSGPVGSWDDSSWNVGGGTAYVLYSDGSTASEIPVPPEGSAVATISGAGIAYSFGYHLSTGQTASYGIGDEGDLRDSGFFWYVPPLNPESVAALISPDALLKSNIHGNAMRFTDRGGNPANGTSAVVQDHYTGLEWLLPTRLGTATWQGALNLATDEWEGSTGWVLPTLSMLLTLVDMGEDPSVFGWIHPAISSGYLTFPIWSSTSSRVDSTILAYAIERDATAEIQTKDKKLSYLLCRKFA